MSGRRAALVFLLAGILAGFVIVERVGPNGSPADQKAEVGPFIEDTRVGIASLMDAPKPDRGDDHGTAATGNAAAEASLSQVMEGAHPIFDELPMFAEMTMV